MSMIYGSVCSGIEAATVAWHGLGWSPAWFSEIEPFPCRVLKHHYPDVPNVGDMLHLSENKIFNESIIDLLVGGTPCQSFSLAGLRGGLADDRGNLALEYCRLLIHKRPRWFVWENVPGVLSSFSGEEASDQPVWQTSDFATLLTAFRECGYCCAWRVLDSQYFGVPQRRRRVFVVGYLGDDWRPPSSVLFERKGLRGDFAPVKKEKKIIAGTIGACSGRNRGAGTDPGMIVSNSQFRMLAFGEYAEDGTFSALKKRDYKDATDLIVTNEPILLTDREGSGKGGKGALISENKSLTLSGSKKQTLFYKSIVRRLTPLECERLQGFPDNYTRITRASDASRYMALGNSMTTNVMKWIGSRIDKVDKILNASK